MGFNIIGHRGVPQLFPENSIKSFMEARRCGLYGIELDIQITGDNRVVVFHDSSTQRILGMDGQISDFSYSEIKKKKIFGGDQEIPLLDDVLKKFPEMKIFIEMKTRDERGDRINEGLEIATHNVLQNFGKQNIVLISFDVVAIREMKEMNISYKTGLDIAEETKIMVDSMLKSRVPGFIDYIMPEFSILKMDKYSSISKLGRKIIPWIINERSELDLLKKLNIDTFLTDRGCEFSDLQL